MGKIDDPYGAAKSQYPEQPENVPGELALQIAGLVFPLVGIVNQVRNSYSQAEVNKRLAVLVDAVNRKVNATNVQIDSPKFVESVRLAVEETWRTTDHEKVKRFGAILGGEFAQSDDLNAPQDAEEFIRTVAQLSERDIAALNILYSTTEDIMKQYTKLP